MADEQTPEAPETTPEVEVQSEPDVEPGQATADNFGDVLGL